MATPATQARVRNTFLCWYLRWRTRVCGTGNPTLAMHESEDNDTDREFQFCERFLQIFWNEQRFIGGLRTRDGHTLEVIHPGTWNAESGPDFRNALIKVDGETRTGDVEIHRSAQDWFRHGHERDPAYGNVLLHAVWEMGSDPVGGAGPALCLELKPHLAAPWQLLIRDLQGDCYADARKLHPGRCALLFAADDDSFLIRMLETAGIARFHAKADTLYRAGVARGFDQALYEGVWEALGYKVNREPMRSLAVALPVEELRRLVNPEMRLAVILGMAGFMPDPSQESVSRLFGQQLPRLWDHWFCSGRSSLNLPWKSSSLRPWNHPLRRLFAGTCWLDRCQLRPDSWLRQRVEEHAAPQELIAALVRDLTVGPEELARRLPGSAISGLEPAGVLGKNRARDILVNIFLPYLFAYGRHCNRPELEELALAAYQLVPALQSNRKLTEAAHRLFVPPSRSRELLQQAIRQQGLMEIYQDFCVELNGNCAICPLCHRAAVAERRPRTTV